VSVTAAPKYGFSVVVWADDVRGAHSDRLQIAGEQVLGSH
jgi:hypothetical protein